MTNRKSTKAAINYSAVTATACEYIEQEIAAFDARIDWIKGAYPWGKPEAGAFESAILEAYLINRTGKLKSLTRDAAAKYVAQHRAGISSASHELARVYRAATKATERDIDRARVRYNAGKAKPDQIEARAKTGATRRPRAAEPKAKSNAKVVATRANVAAPKIEPGHACQWAMEWAALVRDFANKNAGALTGDDGEAFRAFAATVIDAAKKLPKAD